MSASLKRARRRQALAKAPQHDRGPDGPAALSRPCRPVETAVAGVLATQTLDGHLIDRLHRYGQINDRQYEAGLRILEMCDAAGLGLKGTAGYGRQGGNGMSDTMDAARSRWNKAMRLLGSHKADLIFSLCHERHPGVKWLATVQAALGNLADHWKIYD